MLCREVDAGGGLDVGILDVQICCANIGNDSVFIFSLDFEHGDEDLHVDMAFLVAAKRFKGAACVRGILWDRIDNSCRRYRIDNGNIRNELLRESVAILRV